MLVSFNNSENNFIHTALSILLAKQNRRLMSIYYTFLYIEFMGVLIVFKFLPPYVLPSRYRYSTRKRGITLYESRLGPPLAPCVASNTQCIGTRFPKELSYNIHRPKLIQGRTECYFSEWSSCWTFAAAYTHKQYYFFYCFHYCQRHQYQRRR